jgi:hypothetical protein
VQDDAPPFNERIEKGVHMKSILFATLVALAFTAHAKDGGPFAACNADMERLCKDVKPGDGRLVKCMMENKGRASSGCQAVLAEKEKKEKQWQQGQQNKVKHQ